jgi:hypothetical protein
VTLAGWNRFLKLGSGLVAGRRKKKKKNPCPHRKKMAEDLSRQMST